MIIYGILTVCLCMWTAFCVKRFGSGETGKGVARWLAATGGYTAMLLVEFFKRKKRPARGENQAARALEMLQPMERPAHREFAYYREVCVYAAAAVWMMILLGLLMSVSETFQSRVDRISRGREDASQVELEAHVGDEATVPLMIQLQPQAYTREQVEELFAMGEENLEQWILGDNPSLDAVSSDLDLIDRIPGTGVYIDWTSDDYDMIDASGAVHVDKVPEEGKTVTLTARFSYEEQEYLCQTGVHVVRGEESEQERLARHVREAVETAEKDSAAQPVMELPEEVDGKTVSYSRPGGMNSHMWLLLCMFVPAGVFYGKQKDLKNRVEKRNRQLLLDYPEMLSKFSLLLEAGMTIKGVWERITADYVKQTGRQQAKRRYVYEEMLFTCREMEGGMSQREAYDRFGRRCGLQSYMRFGSLLIQNLRKGTGGLAGQLQLEAVSAMEERKKIARELGEEAGTKLLLPMGMMLLIVIVILVVPAFFAM